MLSIKFSEQICVGFQTNYALFVWNISNMHDISNFCGNIVWQILISEIHLAKQSLLKFRAIKQMHFFFADSLNISKLHIWVFNHMFSNIPSYANIQTNILVYMNMRYVLKNIKLLKENNIKCKQNSQQLHIKPSGHLLKEQFDFNFLLNFDLVDI